MTDLQPEYPDFSTRSLAHMGLNCIGPCRVGDNMISRFCPASATLSLKTTALRRSEGRLHMRTRCISCQTEFDPSNALDKYDLKANSHHQICDNACCTKPGFGGSRLCKDHLSAWRDPNPLETDFPQLQNLREHVSPLLQLKWSDEPAMGKVLALMDSIRAEKSPASALRFVDLSITFLREEGSKLVCAILMGQRQWAAGPCMDPKPSEQSVKQALLLISTWIA
jgi:hypothetical protein